MSSPQLTPTERLQFLLFALFESVIAGLISLLGAVVFWLCAPGADALLERFFPELEFGGDRRSPARDLQVTSALLLVFTALAVLAALAAGCLARRTPLSRQGVRTACVLAAPLGLLLTVGLAPETWTDPVLWLGAAGTGFAGYVIGVGLSRRRSGVVDRFEEDEPEQHGPG